MTASLFGWGNPVEIERRRRIRLSVWAYAYEIAGAALVPDGQFDAEALQSDPTIRTGYLDDWWALAFNPSTGIWIHMHPELAKVRQIYEHYHSKQGCS